MKELGVAKKILGMEITRDKKSDLLFLSQHGYIQKILCCFNMDDSKHTSHFKLSSSRVLAQIQSLSTSQKFHILVLLVL
jgi:hypothetical protein